ncbi:MAG TPA: hypothetical protein QGG18_10285 [Rhodospirillales bacterium]|nr:hypothetical protein [Rhodospirillales bacterium]|tara:strand:+ start:382 stop:540 length:159 start_codon:yes stop_codon:yes gene_type:complete
MTRSADLIDTSISPVLIMNVSSPGGLSLAEIYDDGSDKRQQGWLKKKFMLFF